MNHTALILASSEPKPGENLLKEWWQYLKSHAENWRCLNCIPQNIQTELFAFPEFHFFGTSILSPLTECFSLLPQHFRPENKTTCSPHFHKCPWAGQQGSLSGHQGKSPSSELSPVNIFLLSEPSKKVLRAAVYLLPSIKICKIDFHPLKVMYNWAALWPLLLFCKKSVKLLHFWDSPKTSLCPYVTLLWHFITLYHLRCGTPFW